jgi:hypothetical protein
MAARAYHKPDNVVLLDMDRGADTTSVRFPPEGCCQPPPGAKLTVMLFYAKRAAKAELQASGIKVAYIEPKVIRQRAEELLRERWADFERLAQPVLAKLCEKVKSNAQRKQRSNRKGILVQKSGAE